MATGNELVTFDMVKYMREKLEGEIDALATVMSVTSWEDVQKAVRSGIASKIFSIGDQLTCQRNGIDLVWDIIGIDHDTPADPQFTHSMTLQLHDCFTEAMQFDAPEAMYYVNDENGLPAGTYYFTYSDANYQFTLASALPAGSQLIRVNASTLAVSPAKGGAVSGDTIAVTTGSDGTKLTINSTERVGYGSNNYKNSAVRQWLNSDAAAGSVWTAQSDFDRPPSWAATAAGFLNGMDADFLAAVGATRIQSAKNLAVDGGGTDTLNDRFFLLTREEVFAGLGYNLTSDGTPYPYYSEHSDLSAAGVGADANRLKTVNNNAVRWFTRTPTSGQAKWVWTVSETGSITEYQDAYNAAYLAPACNII